MTSASGDYYQLWTNGTAAINYGSTGLENFGEDPHIARLVKRINDMAQTMSWLLLRPMA